MSFHRLRTAIAVLAGLALCAPVAALASSHSEAPGTTKDRSADDTDLYAFVARDANDAVTIVGNWYPLIEPNSGPNFAAFDDGARYYLNVDNVGDAQAHVRFEFTFNTTRRNPNTFLYNTGVVTSLGDADLNVVQTYTLTRWDNGAPTVLVQDAQVAPYYVGPVSMPRYNDLAASSIRNLPGGGKVFVGPRDDPFFVDLGAIFDLLTIRKLPGDRGRGVDGVSNYNVLSIVLQLPKSALTKDRQAPSAALNNHILGFYNSAERAATRTLNGDGTLSLSGPGVQVSRLGMPLVNEVVIPLKDKDRFNASSPAQDGQFLSYVLSPEPAGLLTALYGIKVPPAPRNDLVAIFLTGLPGLNQPAGGTPCEMLRLNLTTPPAMKPNRFGVLGGDVAGFPNGRRLGDDIVDIELRALAGATPFTPDFNIDPNQRLGDGIDCNDRPFSPSFPYLAPPFSPLTRRGHAIQIGRRNGHALIVSASADESASGTESMSSDATLELELGDGETGEVSATSSDATTLREPGVSNDARNGIQFAVPRDGRVQVRVFDVQGRVVRTLVDQQAAAGPFMARWDGARDDGAVAARGVYFVRMIGDGGVQDSRKVILR
ncbi:MAG: DUF4331 family protein [Candidatus Eisenbacteria bacterium]|uniref:DUF4331 family protein n=1 Tax=Eiseniibacteriota bacterium TaxID=2212470 RepID=A0A849SII4_UNCEI|nr:DUF4331 family protein [Candidatus Eisenbacteria bacterium]